MAVKSPLIILILCLLNACTSPPPAPQADYKVLLRSHDPLTDAQLSRALEMLGDMQTNPDVRGYLYERLATEEYARFKSELKTRYREVSAAKEYQRSSMPELTLDIIKKEYPDVGLYALMVFHEPSEVQMNFSRQIHPTEIQYISYMLDFMELPIPYNRKVNGLRNIQRVMAKSKTHRTFKDPEMKEVRKRLYDLALSEESPDIVRRELAAWLREMK